MHASLKCKRTFCPVTRPFFVLSHCNGGTTSHHWLPSLSSPPLSHLPCRLFPLQPRALRGATCALQVAADRCPGHGTRAIVGTGTIPPSSPPGITTTPSPTLGTVCRRTLTGLRTSRPPRAVLQGREGPPREQGERGLRALGRSLGRECE